jgi:hypothetical protein
VRKKKEKRKILHKKKIAFISTDGFCSFVSFDVNALGTPVSVEEQQQYLKVNDPPEQVPSSSSKRAKKEKAEVIVETPAPPSSKRDAVTAFFGAVVPKQPELFVEVDSSAALAQSKPTVFKKKKE